MRYRIQISNDAIPDSIETQVLVVRNLYMNTEN